MGPSSVDSSLSRLERAAGPLNVAVWGGGERVVCVHGSLSWGTFAFRAQRPLAGTHSLVLPDRRGYGASMASGRADFEVDADDVAALLGDGAHLVGHSYGAVVALLAAARRPEAVRSLTVSEPGTLALAPGAAERLAHGRELYAHAAEMTPREFLRLFRSGVHSA